MRVWQESSEILEKVLFSSTVCWLGFKPFCKNIKEWDDNIRLYIIWVYSAIRHLGDFWICPISMPYLYFGAGDWLWTLCMLSKCSASEVRPYAPNDLLKSPYNIEAPITFIHSVKICWIPTMSLVVGRQRWIKRAESLSSWCFLVRQGDTELIIA